MKQICFTPARELARLLRARKVSATEWTKAFIAQIDGVNPKVNAIVTLVPDVALSPARSFDSTKDNTTFGPLAGRPAAGRGAAAPRLERVERAVDPGPDGAPRIRLRRALLGNGRPGFSFTDIDQRTGKEIFCFFEEEFQENSRRLEPGSRRAADGP